MGETKIYKNLQQYSNLQDIRIDLFKEKVCIYIHTYIVTSIQTYTYAFIYTCIEAYLHACNRSFAYAAPALWNGLPKDLRQFAHPPNRALNFTYPPLALSSATF